MKVLCQDCLCLRSFSQRRHEGLDRCGNCGGEFCGCPSCQDTIRLLNAGCLDSDALGLTCDIESWNKKRGIHAKIQK